ncbi:XRE family transcriptional regulator [Colwellia sp. Arc7-D]|nr:XRE family transcriptional regulator [Colwellia sp. Arc7-D]
MSSELVDIGKRIRDIRNTVAMSQSELAYEIGTDKAYISRIERGEVNIGVLLLKKICIALKVKPNDLITLNI